ncbi:MAG: vWA domain-containing protein [Gilvibacter sp.]
MKKIFTLLLIALFATTGSCKGKTKTDPIGLVKTTDVNSPIVHNKHFIKVALLLDTSNSMDGLIDQAKAQLWEIVNELSYARCKSERPELKIALYEYGNDRLDDGSGFIRQVLNFTGDLDEISKELFSLTTNGGSEYCGQVIQTSLNDLNWGKDPDDLKMVFIAGNEPFTQGKVSYKDAATNAKEKDVVVNTIFCGDYNQGIGSYWKDGADLTHGDYMAINHNQRTVHIASPYDDMILQLNLKLNKTYVYYGSIGRSKMEVQATQDSNAEELSTANAVSRTVSKGSHLYKNSSWDLVDAESEEDFDYNELDKNSLPSELQGKTTAEIKSYVAKKKAARQEIQNEIQKLNEKRRVYIAANKKETGTNLESAMIEALKKQAKKKNYTWQK